MNPYVEVLLVIFKRFLNTIGFSSNSLLFIFHQFYSIPNLIGVFRALQSVPRRHNSFYNSTEFRVHELNKRLQQRTEVIIANEQQNETFEENCISKHIIIILQCFEQIHISKSCQRNVQCVLIHLIRKKCYNSAFYTTINIFNTYEFIYWLQESDNCWWDAFATEFFEDDASLTLTFCLEDGPKRYSKYQKIQWFIIETYKSYEDFLWNIAIDLGYQ